ncbi:MAG: methionyl-tRNA formyltransferase [bacterium]|nr:MAG: methionyl-tRNA formyltransferase [bacterium]
MGTPEFAVYSLEKLIKSNHTVVAVVTQPDKPRGRGKKLSASPLKASAELHQIPIILQPISLIDPDFLKTLKSLQADIFVVVAFRILPEAVFNMPPFGTINIHPSLLPKYRGAAPINWTIINGESETGITIMQISKGIDAGGILLQQQMKIYPDETAGSLHDRLAIMGSDLIVDALKRIGNNSIKPISQDDTLATPAPKITKEDCHISFNQHAAQVKNWIHGLSPFPTAFAFLGGERINLYRVQLVSNKSSSEPPGTIIKSTDDELFVTCRPGILNILQLQRQGKKQLKTAEFLRGFQVKSGEKFS